MSDKMTLVLLVLALIGGFVMALVFALNGGGWWSLCVAFAPLFAAAEILGKMRNGI